MLNDFGAVPLGAAVGGAVGGVVGNDVGDVVAVGAPVGTVVGLPVGELAGDDVAPLLTGVGVDAPDGLLVGFAEDVGVGPLDAVDVGNPPGDPVGATDGTTPPVYTTKYAVGGNESTGRFGCNITLPPLDVAGPATVVHVLPCSCAR